MPPNVQIVNASGEEQVVASAENFDVGGEKPMPNDPTLNEEQQNIPGLWGPTHSMDSDDSSAKKKRRDNSTDTSGTKEETVSSVEQSPTRECQPQPHPQHLPLPEQSALGRMYESASAAVGSLVKNASSKKAATSPSPVNNINTLLKRQTEVFSLLLEDACSPCNTNAKAAPSPTRAMNLSESPPPVASAITPVVNDHHGIAPMVPPKAEIPGSNDIIKTESRQRSHDSAETPASRRRQRHLERQLRASAPIPVESLTVNDSEIQDIERSISELTMRSSYGEATAKLADNRRMAYYAVGKHHKNSGRGGNRRCYFTGKLILGGTPFYAGSVQQGLRTLVVFCLPSAIGLPKGVDLKRENSINTFGTGKASNGGPGPAPSVASRESSYGVVAMPRTQRPDSSLKRSGSLRRGRSRSSAGSGGMSGGMSRLSSLDDMSLSLEEDLDPNWGIDRDYLLQVLPAPSQDLLHEMSVRYPDQFETLPVQVRSPHCWRLFIKFCFFSGLPIAEGELHYKVRDEVATEAYGEEIILSHEIMEAVNGESAEILRLPNQKTFRYLRKHYTQQSGKLPEAVFQRTSWEMVLPEI